MVRYELRKLFQNRSLILTWILLFAINGFLLWNLPIPGAAAYSGIDGGHIRSLYAALPEEPEQALAALEAGYDGLWESEGPLLTRDVYSERQLFSTVIERVKEVAGYGDTQLRVLFHNAHTDLSKCRLLCRNIKSCQTIQIISFA